MTSIWLEGVVFLGSRRGAEYLKLPWVRKQIEEKLGFAPYPGTLNVRLHGASLKKRDRLVKAVGMEIVPEPGYCFGKLFHAYMQDTECGIVIPLVPGYWEDAVEIVASTNLRSKFNFVDGSLLKIKVMI